MKETTSNWLSRHRLTIVSLAAIITLLISSIAIIPRVLSIHPGQAIGPHAQYVPSQAFGDTDDLPNGSLRSPRLSIAAGSTTFVSDPLTIQILTCIPRRPAYETDRSRA